jgi:pimeloyl-ACP methyl ester carboxylesterase
MMPNETLPDRAAIVRHQLNPVQGVVLLHGIARTKRSMNRLERHLKSAGFATLNLDYPSRRKSLDALARDIHVGIARFADRIEGPVHFVGHSMGGLLIRVYLADHSLERPGRVVMLGTPNGGSELADRLKHLALYRAFYGPAGQQLSTTGDATLRALPLPDYPIGIIAGRRALNPVATFSRLPRPHDGMVAVRSTRLDGMTDHVVIAASHTGLTHHPAAIAQTIAFLREGRFSPARR